MTKQTMASMSVSNIDASLLPLSKKGVVLTVAGNTVLGITLLAYLNRNFHFDLF